MQLQEGGPRLSTAPRQRQQKEPHRAWAAFVVYRDMGPERSLERLRQAAKKSPGYLRHIKRWSARWHWVDRAQAWDLEQDRANREGQLDASRRLVVERRERIAFQAVQDQEALSIPTEIVLARLAAKDDGMRAALLAMDPDELLKIMVAAARAKRVPVLVEMMARGVREGEPPEEGDEFDAFLERMRDVRAELEADDAGPDLATAKPKREARA